MLLAARGAFTIFIIYLKESASRAVALWLDPGSATHPCCQCLLPPQDQQTKNRWTRSPFGGINGMYDIYRNIIISDIIRYMPLLFQVYITYFWTSNTRKEGLVCSQRQQHRHQQRNVPEAQRDSFLTDERSRYILSAGNAKKPTVLLRTREGRAAPFRGVLLYKISIDR